MSWTAVVRRGMLSVKEEGKMDTGKTGAFLRELRRERGLTQEQLAERFRVSRRTVSRWETGSNLPELTILMELADFYGVDLRELLDGERKAEQMDGELEKTVRKAADYSEEGKRRLERRMHRFFLFGVLCSAVYGLLLLLDCADGFLGGLFSGIPVGVMLVGALMTSRHAARVQAWKCGLLHRRRQPDFPKDGPSCRRP